MIKNATIFGLHPGLRKNTIDTERSIKIKLLLDFSFVPPLPPLRGSSARRGAISWPKPLPRNPPGMKSPQNLLRNLPGRKVGAIS